MASTNTSRGTQAASKPPISEITISGSTPDYGNMGAVYRQDVPIPSTGASERSYNQGQGGYNQNNLPAGWGPIDEILQQYGITPGSGNAALQEFIGLPGSNYTPGTFSFSGSGGGTGGGGISVNYAQSAQPGGASAGQSSYGGQDIQALRNYLQSGAGQFDATPVWEAMIAAQEGQNKLNAANLNEYFNVMGGRFSSAFAESMGNFWEQVAKDQNALLGQLQMASYEAAQGRMFEGLNQLAGFEFTAGENAADRATQVSIANAQIGSQASIAQAQIAAQQAVARMNAELAAWQTSEQGRQRMQELGIQNAFNAAMRLSDQEFNMNQFLIDQSNRLAMNELNQQYGLIPHYLDYELASGNQQIDFFNTLNNIYQSNLRLGADLGLAEWETTSAAMMNEYLEWLRTQWFNNPTIPAQQGQAGSYPVFQQPIYS